MTNGNPLNWVLLSFPCNAEIDTSFTSNKENLFYKVEVLNSLEEVLAYYEGVDKAVIKMTSIDALDKIFFRYTSCGTFNGEKHKYYPDWLIDDSFLVETKNFVTDLVLTKAAAVDDMQLIILDKFKMIPYCEYVAKKYHLNY